MIVESVEQEFEKAEDMRTARWPWQNVTQARKRLMAISPRSPGTPKALCSPVEVISRSMAPTLKPMPRRAPANPAVRLLLSTGLSGACLVIHRKTGLNKCLCLR